MSFEVVPVSLPADQEAAIEFLTSNGWPFHGVARLTREQAAAVELLSDDTASFWIHDGDRNIGLLRAFDLDDLESGSPLLDIRIAESYRGHGVGRFGVAWLTHHLFANHPVLHRIEAITRHDNFAMQAVFGHCGYRLEGRLVEAWRSATGTRHDTLIYAILRREFEGDPPTTL